MAYEENGNGPTRRGIRFDWTFNIGHVATIVTLLSGGAWAWSNVTSQVNVIDERTRDYQVTRDLAHADDAKINALQTVVQSVGSTNEAIRSDVATIRESVASIKATLAARP